MAKIYQIEKILLNNFDTINEIFYGDEHPENFLRVNKFFTIFWDAGASILGGDGGDTSPPIFRLGGGEYLIVLPFFHMLNEI